ncbi:nose resistant to fluoxetine protein 6-like [Arctopsyche grandis]|uniref:nose resistant to fluoxetine protein 6-like n=1 Tax=Arctopsyche grandis TaxID=121162 RepID=UPI00406D8BA0
MHPSKYKGIRSILVFIALFHMCSSEIIDELEYSKMPKMFTMDDYADCLLRPGGLYCVVDIQLMTSKPSDLWYQIKNFSENTLKHYKHDILHKAICVTRKCNVSEEHSPMLRDDENKLKSVLNECINVELQELYELEGDVSVRYCEHKGHIKMLDNYDWSYLAIILAIFIMNGVGTVYHIRCMKSGIKNQSKLLVSLSILSNWKKLMSRNVIDPNSIEKKRSLNGIQGMRFLTMIAVIFSHVLLIVTYGYVGNTIRVETPYDDLMMHLMYNGSLVVQTFFCMASFLMAYNFLIHVEKHPITSVWTYFVIIFQRWARLTPVYALVIGFLCTVYEKLSTGPLWQYIIGDDADSCRRWWWTNLLYINNYVGEGQLCMGVTWYLAADTQLFCYGILVMMFITKFPSIARLFFGFLIAIAVLVPGVLTYKNSYYPTVPQGPEAFRTLYQDSPTFKNIYTTISGNIASYTVGIICGYLHYYIEKNDINLAKIKWFRMLFYLVFPLGVSLIFTGVLFYRDDYVYNPLTAAIYASLYKIAFGILVTTFMLGVFHKCDDIIRGMVEWDGYQIAGRLTYCAYLVHTIPQRYIVGLLKQPYDVLDFNVLCMFLSSITLTYAISMILCIFVEMPFTNLQKVLFQPNNKPKDNTIQESKKIEQNAPVVAEESNGISKEINGEPARNENIEIDVEINNKSDDCSKL